VVTGDTPDGLHDAVAPIVQAARQMRH